MPQKCGRPPPPLPAGLPAGPLPHRRTCMRGIAAARRSASAAPRKDVGACRWRPPLLPIGRRRPDLRAQKLQRPGCVLPHPVRFLLLVLAVPRRRRPLLPRSGEVQRGLRQMPGPGQCLFPTWHLDAEWEALCSDEVFRRIHRG